VFYRRPTGFSMPPWLCIETTVSADRHLTTVWVAGELDRDSAGGLIEAFRVELAGPVPRMIEVDLSAVTFIDAAGVRSLVTCRQLATDAGSLLRLGDPRPQVGLVLAIAGVSEIFGLTAAPATEGGDRRR
jgi:anti-sigma B factor antagonist